MCKSCRSPYSGGNRRTEKPARGNCYWRIAGQSPGAYDAYFRYSSSAIKPAYSFLRRFNWPNWSHKAKVRNALSACCTACCAYTFAIVKRRSLVQTFHTGATWSKRSSMNHRCTNVLLKKLSVMASASKKPNSVRLNTVTRLLQTTLTPRFVF